MRWDLAKTFGKWPWEVDALPFHRYRYLRRLYDKVGEEERKAYERAKHGDDPLTDVDWDAENFTTDESP